MRYRSLASGICRPASSAREAWPAARRREVGVAIGVSAAQATFPRVRLFSIDPPQCRKRPRIPPGPVLRLQFVERRPHGGRALVLGAAVHIVETAASHHPVLTGPYGGDSGVRADIPLPRPRASRITRPQVGELGLGKRRALQLYMRA